MLGRKERLIIPVLARVTGNEHSHILLVCMYIHQLYKLYINWYSLLGSVYQKFKVSIHNLSNKIIVTDENPQSKRHIHDFIMIQKFRMI